MSDSILWHSVCELPDEDTEVLIHTADGEVSAGFMDAGVWRYLSADRVNIPVRHWAHFPEAPKP